MTKARASGHHPIWATRVSRPTRDRSSLESVGPYDILRAHPTNRTELAQWLDQYSFTYATEDLDALAPYMLMGYTVVAARVKLEHSGNVALKPLALSWPGSEIRVPVALSAARDQGAVLTVYIAADGTYQFPSGTIRFSGPTSVMPYAYVTRSDLWINTMYPVDDPVAVHTTDENYQEIEDSYVDVKEPLVVDCEDHNDFGCCGDCNARHSVRPDTVGIVLWCAPAPSPQAPPLGGRSVMPASATVTDAVAVNRCGCRCCDRPQGVGRGPNGAAGGAPGARCSSAGTAPCPSA